MNFQTINKVTNMVLCELLILNNKLTNISVRKQQFFHVLVKNPLAVQHNLTHRGRKWGRNLNSDLADVLILLSECSMGYVLLGYLCLVRRRRRMVADPMCHHQ